MSRWSGLGLRLATAAVLVPLFVGAIVLGGLVFLAAVLVLTAAATIEFYRLGESKPYRARASAGVGLALAFPATFYWAGHDPIAITALVALGVAGVAAAEMLDSGARESIAAVGFTLLGATYAGVLFGHLVLVRELPARLPGVDEWIGAALLGVPLLLTWLNDTVAYFAGHRWGRRKLRERVSPGKTVEGAVAAFVATVAASILLVWVVAREFPPFRPVDAVAIGVLVGVVAPVGDLVESAFKRDAGVKDASGLVPGHGGVLDRFDGVLFAVPAFYYYLLGVVL